MGADLPADTVEVTFATAARLKHQGTMRASFEFLHLFGVLLRRLALLMCTRCDGGIIPLPSGCALDAWAVLQYVYDRWAQRPEAHAAIRAAFAMAADIVLDQADIQWHD